MPPAPTTPPTHPLPDFELAEPEKFDPNVLTSSGNDAVDAFVLTLAHVFNDLKSLSWVAYQMKSGIGNVTSRADDPYLGQVNGFNEWCNRQMISVVNEFLVLVSKSTLAIEAAPFRECLAACSGVTQDQWDSIVDVAFDRKKKAGPFAKYLRLIRNKVGHHYESGPLLEGYKNHFFVVKPVGVSDFAYASLGSRMETTRFFFADAASQAYVRRILDDEQDTLLNRALDTVLEVNETLRFILEAYLRLRAAALRQAV
ncbi:MAG TPA: hypothetical protein VJN96_27330 [Vicinamibacterales bacterium]|nr:hypothetical protein [Vicinamibacterales bacterium]